MYFDTHAHYGSELYDTDREELIASMPARGVELIINPGCTLESSQGAVALAERYDHVYAAVGVHPSDCHTWSDEVEQGILALTGHPKVRAIGEIGLDYYWKDNAPAELQKEVFIRQMEIARKTGLPVIVHNRDAHKDTMDIVRRYKDVRGVCHCYAGGIEDAKILVKMGWMLSFTGVITFKNARRALEIIKWLPMEHIMIETDSPYLTPEPFRGKRNDSGYVHLVSEKIAELKGISPEEAARITTENARRFFNIPG
ncbi:MAG: TatD family hydrolase [Oscillospiraceae bacterium]|nr:TatD family hydrolase [Oscillospiraceae bacterium]